MLKFQKIMLSLSIVILLSSTVFSQGNLTNALSELQKHINGTTWLSASGINSQKATIIANDALLGSNADAVKTACAVVRDYESSVGPLWLNTKTKNKSIPRTAAGFELEQAVIAVMQGLLDHAYTLSNIKNNRATFEGNPFKTSGYFPGAVEPPTDPTKVYTVKVDATLPIAWGAPVMHHDEDARRTTGAYVAPGSYVNIEVPQSLVNKNFKIRVGAHSWDLEHKSEYKRLDRVSILFPITSTTITVTHPLGGGIYLDLPHESDAGVVDLKITGAVRSPLYRSKSFQKTTLDEWKNSERKHPGPWADFESDKVMIQVPTSWITNYDGIEKNIEDWDKALDLVSDLMGLPHDRDHHTVFYGQVDVVIRGVAYHPGYPFSNDTYNPYGQENGNKNHYFLRGPQTASFVNLHEIGHAQLFTKFPGETEAVVNLLRCHVLNRGFGWSLDSAFSRSMGERNCFTLDNSAVMWMVAPNFRDGNPMDITGSTKNEVRYQHRGYAKYAEIAKLFGWEALEDFWHSVQTDYMKGIKYPRNNDPIDNRILRMSRTAGADLRPLIHFWGTHPEKDDTLKTAIHREGLMPSALIYDQLVHYKTLVPKNNAEFVVHADKVCWWRDGTGDPDYGKGWYSYWETRYNEGHGTKAINEVQNIIDYYFPDGRPDDVNIVNKIKVDQTAFPLSISKIGPGQISFSLPNAGDYSIDMFSIDGRKLVSHKGNFLKAGNHSVSLNPKNGLASGYYLVQLKQGRSVVNSSTVFVK